jgi:hypothetical protein
MRRGISAALVGLFALTLGACALDANRRYDRPARLEVGMQTRRFAVPMQPTKPGYLYKAAKPAAETELPDGAAPTQGMSGVSAGIQFTMAAGQHMYMGGEVETGRLMEYGSNLAGAYGVAGVRHGNRFGSLAVEMVAGWRSVRYMLNDQEHGAAVLEPRVRGQLWLSEQFALGAAAGATLGDESSWMAGIYLGVHSHAFGSGR